MVGERKKRRELAQNVISSSNSIKEKSARVGEKRDRKRREGEGGRERKMKIPFFSQNSSILLFIFCLFFFSLRPEEHVF